MRLIVQRKALLACACVGVLVVYYVYSNLQSVDSDFVIKTRKLDDCLSSVSKSAARLVGQYDAIEYTVDSQRAARTFLPFVGNGHFGATNVGQNRLFLQQGEHLQAPVSFDLLLDFTVADFHQLEKVVLDFAGGAIRKFGCYRQKSVCVSARYSAMAHRTIPHLLMQELRVSNPTAGSVRVQLLKRSWAQPENRRRSRLAIGGQEYALSTQAVKLPGGRRALLSVAEPITHDFVTVEAGGKQVLRLLTFVRVGRAQAAARSDALDGFHASSGSRARRLLQLDFGELLAEHNAAWSALWQRGFSIARSLAPGALNGDSVNCTLYCLMSHTPLRAPSRLLLARNISQDARRPPQHNYDRCFSGHDLFQIRHLWRRPMTGVELNGLVEQWLLTLRKFGCAQLVEAGAGGVAQAVLLAIGEFSFSGQHLEFNMHSSQLVRDMTFRNIAYGENASLSVTVEVDDSNKALLFVSVFSAKVFYACGAACREEPVQLGQQKVQLPLRITQPRTAVLYVSPHKGHVRSLRRVIHVLAVRDAPAHEHHVIAMHRHGHPLGGLPFVFWSGLGLLLLVFHMFLFKLIYSELCKGEPVIGPYSKQYYF